MKVEDLIIIYEDNHIIVVLKPLGILSQSDNTQDMDMLTLVKAYLKQKYNKPGNVFLGLVHRLDRMVTGVMVFARTSKAASRLSEQIRSKMFIKKYYAIVNGKLISKPNTVLENYIIRDEKNNLSKIVDQSIKDARIASLEYSTIKSFKYMQNEYTLVDVKLLTGRHHQIRSQFSNLSHPLYGDIKYGDKLNRNTIGIGLWSYYLAFEHPTLKSTLEFKFTPNELYENGLYKKDKIWSVID